MSASAVFQFLKFGIVGFSTTVISFCVYAFLVFVGCPYIVANGIGFIVGTINSFAWNSVFVFRKSPGERRNPVVVLLKTFVIYGLSSFVLGSLLLAFLVEAACLSKYVAPLAVLAVTVPLNFVMNKFWAYRGRR